MLVHRAQRAFSLLVEESVQEMRRTGEMVVVNHGDSGENSSAHRMEQPAQSARARLAAYLFNGMRGPANQ